jgi:predicted nucleic acid-binding protein
MAGVVIADASSLRLALSLRSPVLLLIDERAGRAVARELGLEVAWTAAVIGMARLRGIVPSARDIFEQLHRSDFRIAPEVIRTILQRCGELGPA